MENKDTCCNALGGFVAVPVEEYKELVYEQARNDIVKHLLMAEKTAYIDSNAIRITLGFSPINHTTPNTPDSIKEKPDE